MKHYLSIVLLLFALAANVTACEKEGTVLPSASGEPIPPIPPASGNDDNNPGNSTGSMPGLRITIGGQTLTATLYDNPTARDFAARLPLTVNLSDFAGTEKIFTPSPELTTSGAPYGCHPKAGDIATYAPWRNIAIYYRDGSSFSNDLIPVGRIAGDLNVFKTSGSLNQVRFELTKDNMTKNK